MTEAEFIAAHPWAAAIAARWSLHYRGVTLADAYPTASRGYWRRRTPCPRDGTCCPRQSNPWDTTPIYHTLAFTDPYRENGRFTSPYRTWRLARGALAAGTWPGGPAPEERP